VEIAECSVPEVRLDELDVEFNETCSIEGAGLAEETEEILLGHKLTAAGETLFKEIKLDRVTAV